ncbi:transposase [Streptomyces pharetrae]
MGPSLDGEFIACTGGDMYAFGTARRLAGFAGPAPFPGDSGRIRGNMCRPHRYHRRLLRVCYLSARSPPASAPPRRPSTTARGRRARATSRRSSPSPAAASTSYGPFIRDQRHWAAQPPQPGLSGAA